MYTYLRSSYLRTYVPSYVVRSYVVVRTYERRSHVVSRTYIVRRRTSKVHRPLYVFVSRPSYIVRRRTFERHRTTLYVWRTSYVHT